MGGLVWLPPGSYALVGSSCLRQRGSFGCRRIYMPLLGDLAETSDRPGRAAHPPAFALSGPYIRYLLAFPATGSGGHPCPYGASLGILPHVAYKADVNTGGPRGALSSREAF